MTTPPIERAHQLLQTICVRRGIKIHTKAKTLRGIFPHIRRAAAMEMKSPRYGIGSPSWRQPIGKRVSLISLLSALLGDWQDRARARRITPFQPLLTIITAALSRKDEDYAIPSVPNGYYGLAFGSAAAAKVNGEAIHFIFGRFPINKTSYGRGDTTIRAEFSNEWISRREILSWLPTVPGWRWGADTAGPFIAPLRDVASRLGCPANWAYHPTASMIQHAKQENILGEIATEAWHTQAARMQEQDAKSALNRKARLLARISKEISAKFSDALAAGFCEPGIMGWCKDRHLDPADSIPIATLIKDSDPRAHKVALLVARRAIVSARRADSAG